MSGRNRGKWPFAPTGRWQVLGCLGDEVMRVEGDKVSGLRFQVLEESNE
ncbi:hypothetical protein Cyan10605_1476 [Cyanobacterium aponinum PCC 10605]|uniref:Uncharacterized protein n=1 Tax=Cyanobacterium aponinum (strain PCC 10605) TaxID=755178 RepID=K9Z4B7_CYAAP|nr:hypothetical protein Cyan10605_1476 [Cyanobacterium aponinum PCC 10605]